MNGDQEHNSVAVSQFGEMSDSRQMRLRRAVATNIDGRWSLSTRGSDNSFSVIESDNWTENALMLWHDSKHQPTSLPLFGQHSTSSTCTLAATNTEELTPSTPKYIDSDEVSSSAPCSVSPLMSHSSTAAKTRWSEFDDDSDVEQLFGDSHLDSKQEYNSFEDHSETPMDHLHSTALSPSIDTKANSAKYVDAYSIDSSKKPKPPIKPRKKLPQRISEVQKSRSLGSSHTHRASEKTMTACSSAPTLHVPKAAPRKPSLLHAVSVSNYEQVQTYQSISAIDPECLDKILCTSLRRNGTASGMQHYSISSTFSSPEVTHGMDDNVYEQVQRYEKIQTYETIPFHLHLDYRNT